MNTPTHTLNPNTRREITINGVRFWKLLKHGFKYDEEINRLYNTPLLPDIPKYVPKSRIISPNNHSMIIGGSAYYELLRDNYRLRGGKTRVMIRSPTTPKTLMNSSTTNTAMQFSYSSVDDCLSSGYHLTNFFTLSLWARQFTHLVINES